LGALAPANALHLTVTQHPALPDLREARHLATLYHTCFWVTEGLDEAATNERMLPLLLDGFRACEVQFYSDAGKLEISERGKNVGKPGMKFAPYLAERCAQLAEATPYTAAELARFQQRSGRFHYLVAPLRDASRPAPERVNFVALLRTEECEPFSREDRVLLQAVSLLWARGSQRGRQLGELRSENVRLRTEAGAARSPETPLLGGSPAIVQLRTRLQRVAGTQAPVLLLGETGSGKEVAAQFVHYGSTRRDGAFVKVNCAAIPEGLIESELFGHVRGAFTDAKTDRAGKFQQASGGTLFLDEVGELPPGVQSKLLRAIETGEIQQLGSEKSVHADVRIVAATNRDLAALVQGRQFREDLYYRLNVFAVRVPPLREHQEDLPELAEGFLSRFCRENGLAALHFSTKAFTALKAHAWPGNVRELRNVVQRCALECDGSEIGPEEVASVLSAAI
jgi:transcriptional regulator with GAF, ATPase, and Fis domain